LYQEEEKKMDFAFFFGLGFDTILDCLFSIMSLMRLGQDACLTDLISSPYCNAFI
jgi:hypothetical protein